MRMGGACGVGRVGKDGGLVERRGRVGAWVVVVMGGQERKGRKGRRRRSWMRGGWRLWRGRKGAGRRNGRRRRRRWRLFFLPSPSPYVLHGACGWITKHGGLTRISRVRNSVLIDAFDRDQQDRYDMYRRVKLKKETVRKVRLSISLPFHSLLHTPHHLTHPNPHLPILHKPKPTN